MNKVSVKAIVFVFAALAMTTAVHAKGSEEAGSQAAGKSQVVVRFFNGKTESVEWMDALIERYNKENPGFKVEQEFQKDASNVIKLKFASADYPDFTTVYGQDYADQGLYLDLSGESRWWDRIHPAIREMCTDIRSGKQYRIATNMTMAGLFYNKKIFSELGLKEAKTWDEFSSNLRTIKKAKPDTAPLFMGGKDSWMLGHFVEFMAHGVIKQRYGTLGSRRAFLENDQAKLDFGTQGGSMESFAKRMIQLKEEGLVNADIVTATYDDQIAAFASGKAAMISQGMWALGGILAANPGMKDIGFSPYPPIIDGMKPVVLSAEDSGYCVVSKAKQIEGAKSFLDYLFKPENQLSYSEHLKSPSAFKDVSPDWGPVKDEVAKAVREAVNIGFTTEAPAGFSGDDAGRLVQGLFAGQYASPADFAVEYKSAWDRAWKAPR
jgi:raffinose/stachyose/melibiose transport system substrate-binding protein